MEDPVQLLMKDAGKSDKRFTFDLSDPIMKMKIASIDSLFVDFFKNVINSCYTTPSMCFPLFYLSCVLLFPLSSFF